MKDPDKKYDFYKKYEKSGSSDLKNRVFSRS